MQVSISVGGLPRLCIVCIVILFCVRNVYDDSCNVVDGLITSENPCTQGFLAAAPLLSYSTSTQQL